MKILKIILLILFSSSVYGQWCDCCGAANNDVQFWGEAFPSNPESGEVFIRTDLDNETFTYDEGSGKWVGELLTDGYGDSGGLNNNQYFRRYNGMATGPDRGVLFPYDILIVEHGANWETPNSNSGSIEIEIGGSTILHNLITTGDQASAVGLSVSVPANTVISFRRNGVTISNTQGWIKYRKCLSN